ncbi:VOC family protein [Desulforamulus aquiferis]|uniref:VOC family protein n=1 Tax=Desulforamulus aquiferis TaxID=1397668 RepID=A0AAW7ZHU2_9FIRM|nr:VOC family protein [Desulforamulus aquiferis]MDO7788844.1 VOC family protein [Desulforamulus aquiferis]RYD02343.1 hypothetical protein N752_25665 [Desulforamulus aquiferis]
MPDSFCHIEIPVKDMLRAKAFYEKMFGWHIKVQEAGNYALFAGGGFRRVASIDAGGITPFIRVEDLKRSVGRLEDLGAIVLVPWETAGNEGKCAFFKDPEGNVLGLFQVNP